MARYRLAELAELTKTTPRTVRFYITEGLLPPPEGSGPAAVYTEAHLDRLRLIARLKEGYLPLKEIRRRIATLTDAEVHAEVTMLNEGTLSAPAAPQPEASASDAAIAYLDQVLGGRDAAIHEVWQRFPSAPSPPPPALARREQWQRIVIADGVELHVREDRQREYSLLEALIRQARRLFGQE